MTSRREFTGRSWSIKMCWPGRLGMLSIHRLVARLSQARTGDLQKRRYTNFGYGPFNTFLANREKILPWIAEYSLYALVTPDDPPVYLGISATSLLRTSGRISRPPPTRPPSASSSRSGSTQRTCGANSSTAATKTPPCHRQRVSFRPASAAALISRRSATPRPSR